MKPLRSRRYRHALLTGLSLMLAAVPVLAQHAGHGGYEQMDTTGIAGRTETEPPDDAVLAQAPSELMLHFPSRVRLVKLTLRDANLDWVDISFRYDPRPGNHFVWQLPSLGEAAYYIADWAILASNDELVRGSFSFAFGPGAEPPSVLREAEAMLLQQLQDEPDIRDVAPPPTQIIINRDPPRYDPPFTIELDRESDC